MSVFFLQTRPQRHTLMYQTGILFLLDSPYNNNLCDTTVIAFKNERLSFHKSAQLIVQFPNRIFAVSYLMFYDTFNTLLALIKQLLGTKDH